MNFAFSAEQDELRAVVRRFSADRAGLADTRARLGSAEPWNPATWAAMADELGLLGVDVPEEHGGAGLSTVELAIAAEELGAVVWSGPFLPSVGFAAGLLRSSPQDLAALCQGRRFAVACGWAAGWTAPPAFTWDGTVSGVERGVLQADTADTLLVAASAGPGAPRAPRACDPGGTVLLAVDPAAATVEVVPGIDLTRSVATVTLDGAPARVLTADAAELVAAAHLRAGVALAAEALGGARRCLETATAYAKDRVQFGSPIGAFQAVKHKLADLLVEVELATSAVYLAACHVAAGDPEARSSVPAAVQFATGTYALAAKDSVQVHGGIGFTWEHDAHLHLRRALADTLLLGSAGSQLAAVYASA